jgi:hypothetical protein
MTTLNTRLVLSALGIVAMLTGPAFAQKQHHQVSQPTTQVEAPVTFPTGNTKTGSESNQFEQNNGYYPSGS